MIQQLRYHREETREETSYILLLSKRSNVVVASKDGSGKRFRVVVLFCGIMLHSNNLLYNSGTCTSRL